MSDTRSHCTETQPDLAEARQRDFCRKVVVKLLAAVGQLEHLRGYEQHWFRRSGFRSLDMAWFREHYPEFPLQHIVARRFEHDHDPLPLWPDAFTRFTNTPAFRALREYRKNRGIDDRHVMLGMIFNAGAEFLILHNLDVTGNPQLVRPVGRPPVVYRVQTLRNFLVAVGGAWARCTRDIE